MGLVIASHTRRTRLLALLVLAGLLSAPLVGLAAPRPDRSDHSCCPAMDAPCADSQPCTSLAPKSCCDVAPAAAWPGAAQRECGQMPQATARALSPLASLPALAALPAPTVAEVASPLRLSMVLRN